MFQNPFTVFRTSKLITTLLALAFGATSSVAQKGLQWQNVSSAYAPLPTSVQVFKTTDSIDGQPNIAFYVKARLQDKNLMFTSDTTQNRRFTPQEFYQKNSQPLVVVNTTFFSFATHQNLNVVVKEGRAIAYNQERNIYRAGDSTRKVKVYNSAIGITKRRKADVAWVKTDSSKSSVLVTQGPPFTGNFFAKRGNETRPIEINEYKSKWKVQTAVGGGPVLLQNGQVKITNNEEHKFGGKAIDDKHPRTAMGYTADGYLIILVVEGRNKGVAEGASLTQLAHMLQAIGCVEALNLDGGGSSCLLVNGKETIAPSDKVQRAVPAVFLIQTK